MTMSAVHWPVKGLVAAHQNGESGSVSFKWTQSQLRGVRLAPPRSRCTTSIPRSQRSIWVMSIAGNSGNGTPANGTPKGKQIEVTYSPSQRLEEFKKESGAEDPSLERKSSLTLFSPSKINLFLRVTRKREDGYHELASLFHAIDLGDTVKFSLSPSKTRDSLTTLAPGVPLDHTNLINRALELFRKKTGSEQYFWIHLDKRVPTGAGLGGGSGNAATALWAANQMLGRPATEDQLADWAAEIGSDISFFFSTGCAYCTGRGEIVEDYPPPLPLDTPMCIVKPPEECPTGLIYKSFTLAEASAADPEALLKRMTQDGRLTPELTINDLELPAFKNVPALKQLKVRLAAAGRGRYQSVFMSGSGSSIILVGDDEPPSFIYDEDQYANVFVTSTRLITRRKGEWYMPAGQDAALGAFGSNDPLTNPDAEGAINAGSGVGDINNLKLPFSFEA